MSKTWESSRALTFLVNPVSVFEKELQQMKSREKLNLCALLLVTIFNNNFDNTLLNDDIDLSDRNTLDNILEECGETRGTSRKLIKDHLDTLIGVYLMFEDNSYRFTNERLFEMTFTFMAKTFLKCIIKHCKVSMLCDKFGLECLDESRQHYQFFVPSSFEIFFFERLLKESNDDNFLDIFDCKQMNDTTYRAQFLAFCKDFDSEEIFRIMKLSYFGIDLLHLVSKRGYIDFALFCIEKGVNIDKYDDIGMTPLHTACKYENEKLVNLLLKKGASVNSYRSRGFTALFGACMSGKIQVVKHLLENRADPNLCSGRRLIPLLLASEKGNLEIAKLLIEFGADINKQDSRGITALHQACSSGYEKIVELLLENGANSNECSSDGETPLHITCSTSFYNIMNMLVAKRADLMARSGKTGLTPLNVLQRDNSEVLVSLLRNVISKDEMHSIIEYALKENDKNLVEILIKSRHTEINEFMDSGKTALHIACLNGDLDIANLLIENQANVNTCTTKGETVIQLACLSSNCDLVKLLITKGAKIVDSNQSTILPLPLHIGCLLNNYEMCSLLLHSSVSTDINKSVELTVNTVYAIRTTKYVDDLLEKVGQWHNCYVTPLEIACLEQNIDIMRLLLNNGADPNICFHSGSFPLALACIFEDEKMVDLLLNNRSNVNTFTDIDDICNAVFQCGNIVDIVEKIAYKQFDIPTFPLSPLHIASISNNINIVQMLLNSKANSYVKCSISPMVLKVLSKTIKSAERHEVSPSSHAKCSIIHNVLPLHIACLIGNDDIVEILLQNNTDYGPYYTESLVELNTEQVMCIHGLLDEFDIIPNQEQKFMLSPIQIACFSSHWTILKKLFEYGSVIFETCEISNTLMACFNRKVKDSHDFKYKETIYKTSVENILYEFNHISIIRDLKDLGLQIDTDHFNKMLETFVNSCYTGDLQTVGTLVNIIEDLSIIYKNKAAIHYACEANHAEVVDLLVSHKAEVNCRAMDCETPIHIATRNECTQIIEFLIRNGGNPSLTNNDGDNSFHIACMKDNAECLLLLFQFTENSFIDEEYYYEKYIDTKNISGMSPLSIAYNNRNKNILEILILKGADIDNIYGLQQETLLFKACKDGEEDIVSFLLEKSASTNVYNVDRKTPLYISCCLNYDKITCKLLENNANVNINSYDCYSPLYHLCMNNNVKIAKMLLQKDANVDFVLGNTESLLIMACKLNHPDIVDLLLQYNADVNYCHYSGETALYFAFEDGNIDMVRRLLNNNADLNVCKHERDFFLYLACKRGHYDLMKLILEHHNEIEINKVIFNGLNVNKKRNKDGHTAIHIACAAGNKEVVKFLLSCKNIKPEDANATLNVSNDVHGQGVQNLLGKTSIEKMENILPIHLACLLDNEEIMTITLIILLTVRYHGTETSVP
ncbi:ankyrin-3-like [Mytilus trossulus]|uniref:ankyrin-3-like n=1 Tax=Mytilus trossulus TaxID=6551 RepID=UPI003007ED59